MNELNDPFFGWIGRLASRDASVRRQAFETLVQAGEHAVPALVRALSDRRTSVRAAAARGLGEIRSPRACESLLAALCDPDREVRELAARALLAIGDVAARPLLRALIRDPHAPCLRESASMLLRAWVDEHPRMRAVLDALESGAPEQTVAVAAGEVLATWTNQREDE